MTANPSSQPFELEDDDDPEELAAYEQARTDFEAGRFVTHDVVERWLLSWGTENELPRPKCD